MKPPLSILLFCCGLDTLAQSTTYYIDYMAGSDANNGLSTNVPWQHHPYMAVPGDKFTGSYIHQPGDQFIFRGGIVWPYTCFNTNGNYHDPVWDMTVGMAVKAAGTVANPDYYGVQSNWYSGAAFTRPVFDGGYVASTLICIDGPHNGASNLSFNGLELRHVNCISAQGPGLATVYDTSYVTFSNCYLHGWTLTNSLTAPGTDGAHGGFIGEFDGTTGIVGLVCDHCEIENIENFNAWNGVCVRSVGVLNYCAIHDNSSGILFAQDVNHCTVSDIDWPVSGYDPDYHCNGFAMDLGNGGGSPAGVNEYCRNSYFHDCGNSANMVYPSTAFYDCYVYNNVLYGYMSQQLAIEVDPYDPGVNGVTHSAYIYNNTIVNYGTNVSGIHFVARDGLQISNAWLTNNLIIGNQPHLTDANSTTALSLGTNNNLVMDAVTATTAGYTLANVYQPTSAANPTVGTGANLSSLGLFTTDILGVPWANPPDVGAYQYRPWPGTPTNFHGLFLKRL